MAANRNTDLLAADSTARVDPSKRMLAGLSSRKGSRAQRLKTVAVVGAAVGFFVLGVTMLPHNEELALDAPDDALPSIPVETPRISVAEVSHIFMVSRSPPLMVTSLATPLKGVEKQLVARRPRRRSPGTTSMDVAILSVLVEHIDAERRADRAPPRAVR